MNQSLVIILTAVKYEATTLHHGIPQARRLVQSKPFAIQNAGTCGWAWPTRENKQAVFFGVREMGGGLVCISPFPRHGHQTATPIVLITACPRHHRIPPSTHAREGGIVCARVCTIQIGREPTSNGLHRKYHCAIEHGVLAVSHAGDISISGNNPLRLWCPTCKNAEDTHRWLFDRGHLPLSVILPLEGDVGHVEHGRKRSPHL